MDQMTLLHEIVANGGSTAERLLANNMNPEALRTNATLRKDEWQQLDTTLVEVAQKRMVGVNDLMSRGLRFNISNGMGTTVLQHEEVADTTDAEVDMAAINPANADRPEFTLRSLPLPITHKNFQFSIREIESSRRLGQTLDVTQQRLSAEKVAQKIEDTLFNGLSAFTFGGGTIRGYTDFPNRNTVTLATNWDASAKTGEQIIDDVKNLKQANIDARHFGPYVLYIPTAYETVIDGDFKANSDRTIRERILAISGIDAVQVSDFLSANNVVLVEMDVDTVRMVVGLPMTNVEWQTLGGMMFHFKVLTIMVPQLRADQESQSGIAHLA